MSRRGAAVVGFGVLAACTGGTGGTGDCMYPSGGALTFVVQGGAYPATCFRSVASGLPYAPGVTIEASPPPPTAFRTSGVAVEIDLVADQPSLCPLATGATVSLASNCLAIWAREVVNAGTDHLLWTVVGGAAVMPGVPEPTGSLTVDAWTKEPGRPLAISFSSDAALAYPANLEHNGSAAALAPISGSIVTVAQPAGG